MGHRVLGEEAEVVAILLGELHQVPAQGLGRLFDELLEVDDLVVVCICPVDNLPDLLILEEVEAQVAEGGPHLVLVERPCAHQVSTDETK